MSLASSVFKLAAAAGAVVGGAAFANAAIAASSPKLEEWFEGDKGKYFWRGHRIAYTARGEGHPVVLVHGIHAAASSYEWRRNIDVLASRYRVYALDLPGFGHSDRPAMEYTGDSYVSFLTEFIRDVPDGPVRIVASSLACAYAIHVAYRTPSRVDRLALVCPVGIGRLDGPPSVGENVAHTALRVPVVGEALFNALASEASIRYFLESQVFADPTRIDEDLVRQMYATSHRRGARYAPAAFIGGALNLDVTDPFARLPMSLLLVWGERAKIVPVEDIAKFKGLNQAVRVAIAADSGLMPHEEEAAWFNSTVLEFLA
jgi:pimeloyl-ACP methyl ester carboxylesterase